jgi:nitrate reductase assembly molybdenum cofactor insertion protein NarJ
MATAQIVLYSGQDPAVIMALQHFVRVLQGLDLSEADRQAVETFGSQVEGLTEQGKGSEST